MTIFEDIDKWAKELPLNTKRLPTVLKVNMKTYTELVVEGARQLDNPYKGPSLFTGATVEINDDLQCNWIMYDQYGEEMKRSE